MQIQPRRPARPLVTRLALVGASALLAMVMLPFLSPSHSRGQSNVSGVWTLNGSVQQAEATVAQAIEPAVVPLAPDVQRLARARLAESTWVPQVIRIDSNPSQISVTIEGSENRTFTTPPGQPQNIYSRSGVRASLIQTVRPDGGLQQHLRAMDGTQVNIYSPSPDGRTMALDVLIQARRLAQDVRFRVTYVRAG